VTYTRLLAWLLGLLLTGQVLFGIFVMTNVALDTLNPQRVVFGLQSAQALQLEPFWLRGVIFARELAICATAGLVFFTRRIIAPLSAYALAYVLRTVMWFEFTGNPLYEPVSPDWLFFVVDSLVLTLLVRRWMVRSRLVD